MPCVNNMIKDARMHCDQGAYFNNILKLKKASTYNLIFKILGGWRPLKIILPI